MEKNYIIKVILIILTILIFSSIAIVVIIISKGGSVTSEGIIRDSGTIKIKIEPSNINYEVYLNDEKAKVSDNRINRINEGIYDIRIESTGYNSWEKKIIIKPGLVNNINVRLYPESFNDIEQLTRSNIDSTFYSENGEFVYYIISNSDFGADIGLWRLKLIQGLFNFSSNNTPEKISDITLFNRTNIDNLNYEIIPSPDNSKILFKDGNEIFIINISTINTNIVTDISTDLGLNNLNNIVWFGNSNNLIIDDNNIIYEYNLNNKVKTLITYNNANNVYDVANSSVYIYKNNTIYKYVNSSLIELELNNIIMPSNILNIHIAKNNDNNIILETAEGYYYLNIQKGYIKQIIEDNDYNILFFAKNGGSALFENNRNLFTLEIEEILALNTIETKLTYIGITLQDDDFIKYNSDESHYIYYNSAMKSVEILEVDGFNKLQIIQNNGINPNNFSISGDSRYLVLLLRDEFEENNEDPIIKSNLYRINLNK
jgi:hypothetical protein